MRFPSKQSLTCPTDKERHRYQRAMPLTRTLLSFVFINGVILDFWLVTFDRYGGFGNLRFAVAISSLVSLVMVPRILDAYAAHVSQEIRRKLLKGASPCMRQVRLLQAVAIALIALVVVPFAATFMFWLNTLIHIYQPFAYEMLKALATLWKAAWATFLIADWKLVREPANLFSRGRAD